MLKLERKQSKNHVYLTQHATLCIFIFGWWCHDVISTTNLFGRVQKNIKDLRETRLTEVVRCDFIRFGIFSLYLEQCWGLMIRYALLVGALLRGTIHDWSCGVCGFASETLHHAFWECVSAKCFWSRILRLLGRKYRLAIFTWGTVYWGTLAQQTVFLSSS